MSVDAPSSPILPRQRQLFFEAANRPSLARRALGEGVATMALTMAVVFAAKATWLGPLRPLALGIGVPAAVAALTLTFGPATGGHFNPLVTASQWMRGHRNTRCLVAYVCAQLLGAFLGAVVAVLFVLPATPDPPASTGAVIGSEIFASTGLITIVLASSLVTGPSVGLLGVLGWLVMINLAMPAAAFANPVLALAAPLAMGTLRAPMALTHIAAECIGASMALLVVATIYPSNGRHDDV